MALILQQAGKSADEVAALATLDDADRSAENQFSGCLLYTSDAADE